LCNSKPARQKREESKKKPYEKPVIIEKSGMNFPREIMNNDAH
jgi:hypothetical protein